MSVATTHYYIVIGVGGKSAWHGARAVANGIRRLPWSPPATANKALLGIRRYAAAAEAKGADITSGAFRAAPSSTAGLRESPRRRHTHTQVDLYGHRQRHHQLYILDAR